MKLHKYIINAKSSYGTGCNIMMLAPKLKEAQKFCKAFDGLKIIEYIHGTITITWTDSIDEIMQNKKKFYKKD